MRLLDPRPRGRRAAQNVLSATARNGSARLRNRRRGDAHAGPSTKFSRSTPSPAAREVGATSRRHRRDADPPRRLAAEVRPSGVYSSAALHTPRGASGTALRSSTITHPVESPRVARRAASTKGRVIAVVQPHRYTRLHALFNDFCTCFNDADAVIVAPVYAAGEQPIEGADRDGPGLRTEGARPPPGDRARGVGRPGADRRRARRAGGLRRLPRRGHDHAMGAGAARRARGARDAAGVSFPDITGEIRAARARLARHARGERAGPRRSPGSAPAGRRRRCFAPADEADLAHLLAGLPDAIPVTVVGLGSKPARARRRPAWGSGAAGQGLLDDRRRRPAR